jgi:hypothetical protein
LAGPLKAKLPWNGAGFGNEATGNNNDHDDDATNTNISQLHHDGKDASLQ